VEVGEVEDEAEFGGAGVEGAGQCDRIGSAGKGDGEARAGGQAGGVEREHGGELGDRVGGGKGQSHNLMVDQCILCWLCTYLRYFPPLDWARVWPRPSRNSFLS
jgi:hypothetical protein